MKNRYRLISRGSRGGAFYCVDGSTGKRTSLGACSRDEAEQVVLAKNQSLRQPALNLQIARAYLGGSDEGVATRTWQHVMDEMPKFKTGETKARWLTAIKDILSHEDFLGEQRSSAIERLGIVDLQGCVLIELILNLRFQVEALDAITLVTALNAHDVIRRRKAIPYIIFHSGLFWHGLHVNSRGVLPSDGYVRSGPV